MSTPTAAPAAPNFNSTPQFAQGAPKAPNAAAPKAAPAPAPAPAPEVPGVAPATVAPTSPAAPTAPQAAPAPTAPQAAPAVETVDDGKKKWSKTAERELEQEDIKFILENVVNYTYVELAEKRGLTKNQVSRVLMDTKMGLRGKVIAAAEAEGKEAYAMKTIPANPEKGTKEKTSTDWNNPVSEQAIKLEEYIKTKLSRPANTGIGGGGKVKAALDDEVNSILDNL